MFTNIKAIFLGNKLILLLSKGCIKLNKCFCNNVKVFTTSDDVILKDVVSQKCFLSSKSVYDYDF